MKHYERRNSVSNSILEIAFLIMNNINKYNLSEAKDVANTCIKRISSLELDCPKSMLTKIKNTRISLELDIKNCKTKEELYSCLITRQLDIVNLAFKNKRSK